MISYINLFGFKSFIADTIELNNLTLLTGLNSSGKSSVIQAILMLENASKSNEVLLSGHGDIAELKNSYTEELSITAGFPNGAEVIIEDGNTRFEDDVEFPEIIYISADRFGPEATLPVFIGKNYTLGKKGENILKCIEHYNDDIIPASLRHKDAEGDTFGFNLEAWLGVVSPNIKFRKQLQKLSDTSYATFNGHRAKNVGFGLSYTLPVLTALLLGKVIPYCLVMIENPEAHLHPRGQTEIGRLIALCAKSGVQVIVETHSDHLINSIRAFVKEDDSNLHEKINLHWFELDENGNTDATLIHLDENGRLEDCPEGLLDQFQINASKLL